MGIRGLPKAMRDSGAIAGQPLKESSKPVHVDFLAYCFRLVQTIAFGVLQNGLKKAGSISANSAPAPELKFETDMTTASSRKRKNVAEHSPASIRSAPPDDPVPFGPKQTLTELLEDVIASGDHKNIFIHPDGLSDVEIKKDQQNFRSIGYILDDVLSSSFNKNPTVLHVDGKASEQKRQEHRRRNEYLRKALGGLQQPWI
ncbi:hypothetical protein EMPS_07491 [Entomortierella parvispora]|uniref:Uncharacterized protein n=1 Tax=Entomortierella parvispora TaxID=205924 RepID=A0A9P3HEM8_9FUNG|nr:hypothetical protein EMPS_07491 [Entomortierella parvispora]